MFKTMRIEPKIEFIDLPTNLRGKYQYYTCANMNRSREAGFAEPSTSLEDGLRLYVRNYLDTDDPFC